MMLRPRKHLKYNENIHARIPYLKVGRRNDNACVNKIRPTENKIVKKSFQ